MRSAVRSSLRLGLFVAGAGTLIASCGGAESPSTKPPSTITTLVSVPVQSGYAAGEDFCAQIPLQGTIEYRVTSGRATIRVAVGGLPRNAVVGIDWAVNTVRGPLVGTVRTDGRGDSIPSSGRLFRTGEARGYRVVLTSADDARALGNLWPCGPPPLGSQAVAVDPTVTVTPESGLVDGQPVRVTVAGFGVGGKVFLSECDAAEDANALGCGQQLAAQPFVVTSSDRSGAASFVVTTSAATKPYDPTVGAPCTQRCVIVATQGGDGAWAVAAIAFGSSSPVGPVAGRS
jgi:Neocarzinostatin family